MWSSAVEKILIAVDVENTLKKKITQLEDALNMVNDTRTFSINKSLSEIEETSLYPQIKQNFTDPQFLINTRVQGIQSSVYKIVDIMASVSGLTPQEAEVDEYEERDEDKETRTTARPQKDNTLYGYNAEDNTVTVIGSNIYFTFKNYEEITFKSIVKCFKKSMNELVKKLHMKSDEVPFLFSSELCPNFPELMLVPNLQEIQQTLNDCIKCKLQSTEQVQTFVMTKFPDNPEQNNQNQSGKGRNVPDKRGPDDKERALEDKSDQNGLSVAQREEFRAKNYLNYLTGHYPIIALIISMTNKMRDFQPQITDYIAKLQKYSSIWEQQDGESAFAAFEAKEPSIREIKGKMDNFVDLVSNLEEITERAKSTTQTLRTLYRSKQRNGSRSTAICSTKPVAQRYSTSTTSSRSTISLFQRKS